MNTNVKINGVKHLDQYDFHKIIIRQNSKNSDFLVSVKGLDKKFPTLPTGVKFSKSLKEMNSIEKINAIIDRFLDYNTITRVADNKYISHYDGKFNIISGLKDLNLRLYDPELKPVAKKIVYKYRNDRMRFCEENSEINRVSFYTADESTSYEKEITNYGESIKFYIFTRNGKIPDFEKEFLEEFISEKLYAQDEPAYFKEQYIYSITQDANIFLGTYLNCGNFSMKINSTKLVPIITKIIDKYNLNREKNKIMQLKMEGF